MGDTEVDPSSPRLRFRDEKVPRTTKILKKQFRKYLVFLVTQVAPTHPRINSNLLTGWTTYITAATSNNTVQKLYKLGLCQTRRTRDNTTKKDVIHARIALNTFCKDPNFVYVLWFDNYDESLWMRSPGTGQSFPIREWHYTGVMAFGFHANTDELVDKYNMAQRLYSGLMDIVPMRGSVEGCYNIEGWGEHIEWVIRKSGSAFYGSSGSKYDPPYMTSKRGLGLHLLPATDANIPPVKPSAMTTPLQWLDVKSGTLAGFSQIVRDVWMPHATICKNRGIPLMLTLDWTTWLQAFRLLFDSLGRGVGLQKWTFLTLDPFHINKYITHSVFELLTPLLPTMWYYMYQNDTTRDPLMQFNRRMLQQLVGQQKFVLILHMAAHDFRPLFETMGEKWPFKWFPRYLYDVFFVAIPLAVRCWRALRLGHMRDLYAAWATAAPLLTAMKHKNYAYGLTVEIAMVRSLSPASLQKFERLWTLTSAERGEMYFNTIAREFKKNVQVLNSADSCRKVFLRTKCTDEAIMAWDPLFEDTEHIPSSYCFVSSSAKPVLGAKRFFCALFSTFLKQSLSIPTELINYPGWTSAPTLDYTVLLESRICALTKQKSGYDKFWMHEWEATNEDTKLFHDMKHTMKKKKDYPQWLQDLSSKNKAQMREDKHWCTGPFFKKMKKATVWKQNRFGEDQLCWAVDNHITEDISELHQKLKRYHYDVHDYSTFDVMGTSEVKTEPTNDDGADEHKSSDDELGAGLNHPMNNPGEDTGSSSEDSDTWNPDKASPLMRTHQKKRRRHSTHDSSDSSTHTRRMLSYGSPKLHKRKKKSTDYHSDSSEERLPTYLKQRKSKHNRR